MVGDGLAVVVDGCCVLQFQMDPWRQKWLRRTPEEDEDNAGDPERESDRVCDLLVHLRNIDERLGSAGAGSDDGLTRKLSTGTPLHPVVICFIY